MRWTTNTWALALLLAVVAGCKQQCFLRECDFEHYRKDLSGMLEYKPDVTAAPVTSVIHSDGDHPTTVFDPDRKVRYLSLAEAISIALEQGTRGPGVGTGTGDDTLVRFNGFGRSGALLTSDHIRVLSLNPALAGTNLEGSLSRFDAVYVSSMTWNVTDQPVATALQSFQARSSAINAIQTDAATFSSQLLKPLPTGGVAGITFNTTYNFTNLAARVNPSYAPQLLFQFEQPLLQGFGTEINQLRQFLPGSILTPGFLGQFGTTAPGALTGNEGILISRIRIDQERAEFEADVNQMLLNVEVAYWNLYGAYWTLYARELGLRLAYESWKITGAKYYAGNTKLANFARTRGQYELFRGQRLQALGQVLENERQLRKLLGMMTADKCRLVPSDTPTLAPYHPDWCASKQECLNLRPELIIAREGLKASQLDVINSKNLLLPDLRFTSTYDVNAIGGRLDGPDPSTNAFRALAQNRFNDWSAGLRLVVPIGFRQAHSNLRRARLALAQSYALLKDQEIKAEQYLAQQWRRLMEFHEQIRAQRAQREAYGLQLRLEFERVGEQITADDTVILEAERFYTDALANEYNAIVQYNNVLANFEYAKGTILQHNNVVIAEGALPSCAQERAVEAQRKRTHSLVLAQRQLPVHCQDCKNPLNLPNLPSNEAVALPSLFEGAPTPPTNAPSVELQMPRQAPAGQVPSTGPFTPATPEGGQLPRTVPSGNTPVGQGTGLPPATPAGAGAGQTGQPQWTGQSVPPTPPTTSLAGTTVPPARPERFGASTMLPPSPVTRDSTPSLQSDAFGTTTGPSRP